MYRIVPRQTSFGGDAAGQVFQKELEIRERPQAIGLGGFHDGVDGRAGTGPPGRVGEQ